MTGTFGLGKGLRERGHIAGAGTAAQNVRKGRIDPVGIRAGLGRRAAVILCEVFRRADKETNDGLVGGAVLQGADKAGKFTLSRRAAKVLGEKVRDENLPVFRAGSQLIDDARPRPSGIKLSEEVRLGLGVGRAVEKVIVDRIEPSRVAAAPAIAEVLAAAQQVGDETLVRESAMELAHPVRQLSRGGRPLEIFVVKSG